MGKSRPLSFSFTEIKDLSRAPSPEKRKSFSFQEKSAILHGLGPDQSNIALSKELGVSHFSISTIKKNKDKIQPLFNVNVRTCKDIHQNK